MGVERGAAGDRHRDKRRALREAWCVARVTYRPELGAPRRSRQPRLTCVPPSPHTHPPPSRSSIPRTPPPLVLLPSFRRSYCSQRASPGGLLITEATNISPEAMAYMSVPGIWTDEQVAGWRQVTEGVHAKGGKVVCQLWHTGRVAVPSYGEHPLLRRSDHVARRGLAPGVSSSASAMLHPRSGKPLGTVRGGGGGEERGEAERGRRRKGEREMG